MLDRPDADLVSRVRSSCARACSDAELVVIDHERLLALDPNELFDSVSTDEPDPAGGTKESAEQTAMLVFALDAVNFGSGYHDIVRKRPGMSGATSMATCLTDYVESIGSLSPEHLTAITPLRCSEIFGQELAGDAVEELMTRFAQAFNDLGRFIEHHRSALAVIEAAAGSAVSLAESLTSMPFYRDVQEIEGVTVSFYKRAQITAADLARRLPKEHVQFHDLRRLTAFADNLVPHVLRVDGVLVYDPALSQSIDQGYPLTPGSRAEIEIRAAGVHAVELLAASTGRRPMDIDEALWLRGSRPEYKSVPRHRARSVFY